jgi:hypothetical protein
LLCFVEYDGHMSGVGNRIVAEHVLKYLRAREGPNNEQP